MPQNCRNVIIDRNGATCKASAHLRFESTIQEPKVREYFESLGLDIWDAWSFFKMLDSCLN